MELDLESLADAPYKADKAATPERNSSPLRKEAVEVKDDADDADEKQRHREGSTRERSSRRDERDGHRDRDRDREKNREKDRDGHRSSRRDSRDERRRDDRHRDSRGSRDLREDPPRDDRSRRDERRRSKSPRNERNTEKAVAEFDRAERQQSPELTEEERDQRTVFVQQLAARLRTKEIIRFFEKAGPVRDAQIVKDRVSGRSKGVGYVEFRSPDSIPAALSMTGQKLLGIPIIAQLTEAEKNRQAREEAIAQGKLPGRPTDAPFHRLYVGNIHFSIGEEDLQAVFEPFGDLEFVSLQKDESGRSRGYGFVQYKESGHAREALEKLNGYELANRPIRVGLGNDKFVPEGVQIQGRFSSKDFERDNGPPVRSDKRRGRGEGGGPRELDDNESGGVSFNSISRNDLMRKLARDEDRRPSPPPRQPSPPPPARGVLLKNMFNPADESDPNWQKELEEDVKAECAGKYGEVVHIHVEENSLGEIYVKFADLQSGNRAIQGLNGRWFGGRTIGAAPLLDAIYNTKFPAAKDL